MPISEQGLALMRRFEGFSPTVYRCPAGRPTIGYGHVVRIGESFAKPITLARAEQLLAADAERAAVALKRYVSLELSQNQEDALISFIYNVGIGAFARSTLRKVVNRGWHGEVPAELSRWIYAGGKVLPGLVARRQAEARLYARG